MSTNPYFTQYHTQRFSLIGSPQQRDGTSGKDQRFVNMYPELIKSPISDGKKYYLKKRPGTGLWNTFGSGAGRGIHYWSANNNLYSVIGNTVYWQTNPFLTLATSTGAVGWCEFKNSSNLARLLLSDGTNLYVIHTDNTYDLVSGGDFPTPHIANPVFLDGYIFLAGANSQSIFNSNLEDPTTWTAGNFINAEMFPDNIIALAKTQNYLAVIKQGSIEWFYDNANATGSPMQRNAPAVTQFGCPAPQTVVQTEKQLIMVADTGAGGRTVWILDGFQPTEIANEPVREALDNEGSSISQATAFTVQCAGHKWYVLNLYAANRTFVYDFEEQMWHEWASPQGGRLAYDFATDNNTGTPYLLGSIGPGIVQMAATWYQELGVNFTCSVRTTKIDFDTQKRKRFYRLTMIGDAPNGDNNVPMTVQWSDDDYNTWSSGTNLNLNGTYQTITQLGYSRRRAFQFSFTQPYPLRLEAFEVDIIQEVRR